MTSSRPVGRPALPPEVRAANKKASIVAFKAKSKNVTIDADLQAALHDMQDDIEASLGVRLNLSQTVRYLIAQERKRRTNDEGPNL